MSHQPPTAALTQTTALPTHLLKIHCYFYLDDCKHGLLPITPIDTKAGTVPLEYYHNLIDLYAKVMSLVAQFNHLMITKNLGMQVSGKAGHECKLGHGHQFESGGRGPLLTTTAACK